MNERPGGISDELRPYVDRGEAEGIDRVGEVLERGRAVPAAGFRAELRARLIELSSAPRTWRPGNLRAAVAAYCTSGFVLLAIAALGAGGVGPLG